MTVEGAEIQAQYDDHNNNQTALVSFAPDTRDIVVNCAGLVQTADNAGIIGPHTGCMPLWAFLGPTDLTRPGARLRALAARFRGGSAAPLDQLHALSAAVHDAVAFEIGHTDARTTAELALSAGQGVCQDHAHVFIAAARLLDIPARYVSGYLLMDEQVEQQAGHGWAEAHIDELGWVGFDIANGVCPDERYVRVATGFDYRDAAPVTGISLGAGGSETPAARRDRPPGAPPERSSHRCWRRGAQSLFSQRSLLSKKSSRFTGSAAETSTRSK